MNTKIVKVVSVGKFTVDFSDGEGVSKEWCPSASVGQTYEITTSDAGYIESVKRVS